MNRPKNVFVSELIFFYKNNYQTDDTKKSRPSSAVVYPKRMANRFRIP